LDQKTTFPSLPGGFFILGCGLSGTFFMVQPDAKFAIKYICCIRSYPWPYRSGTPEAAVAYGLSGRQYKLPEEAIKIGFFQPFFPLCFFASESGSLLCG